MINVNYKISKNILIKVNENIYYIIEFFNECCKGLDYETFLVEIFPEFLVRKNKERCIEVVQELEEYTKDFHYHNLTPIQKYALFHLFEWWLEVSECDFDQVIDEKDIKTEDDRDMPEDINNIEEYKGAMFFDDWDFLDENLSYFIEAYKKDPFYVRDYLDVDLDQYVELMPDDKKKEYYYAKEKIELSSRQVLSTEEELIIKSIYNAIKLKEKDPRRLQNTSETQLSDDIRDIIMEKLNDHGLIVAREMPSGFSKKRIGECDLYVYILKNGIFRAVAVGENKEWGSFENQLKQLMGYMTLDTSFGFTIIFNKRVRLQTVLDKREEILKNFYVELNGKECFRVVDRIKEVDGITDVLVTTHRNPEKDNSYFKVYHFIINAKLDEREASAVQARE